MKRSLMILGRLLGKYPVRIKIFKAHLIAARTVRKYLHLGRNLLEDFTFTQTQLKSPDFAERALRLVVLYNLHNWVDSRHVY